MPALIAAAAAWIAVMEEPHRRFTVWPETSCGRPASSATWRAMLKPCSRVCCTQPQITSSISLGFTAGLRLSKAFTSSAERFSARTLRNTPPLERPIGVRTASTITTSVIAVLRKPLLGVVSLALGGHFLHASGRLVELAETGVLARALLDQVLEADEVGVLERTAQMRREADAQDQAHVGLVGGLHDLFLETARGLDHHGDHQAVDDFLLAEIPLALGLHRGDQPVAVFGHDLLRFALGIGLVLVETDAVFLAVALVLVHHVQRGLEVLAHAVRITLGEHVADVMAGVDAHHVLQIGRAHGPAEAFRDLVDLDEIGAVAQQRRPAAEI